MNKAPKFTPNNTIKDGSNLKFVDSKERKTDKIICREVDNTVIKSDAQIVEELENGLDKLTKEYVESVCLNFGQHIKNGRYLINVQIGIKAEAEEKFTSVINQTIPFTKGEMQ